MQHTQIAQAPTATPTPGPWATLTPYPTSQATIVGVDGQEAIVMIAEKGVQGYQSISSYPAFTVFQYSILLLIVLLGLRSIIRHIQEL